jgi:uncharacterized protein (DUF488 family)
MSTVYTIGHSTHSIQSFVGLLRKFEIAAIADVRSAPYSRRNPQFNQEALQRSLRKSNISYVFLGAELGGRGNSDSEHDEHGRIKYRSIAESVPFCDGLRRVEAGSARMHLALMCAESDPLDCHRGILISRILAAGGTSIMHIHADGHLEAHSAAENRLLRLFGLPEADLFRTEDQVLAEAYERQEARIAYVIIPNISQREETVG